MMQKEGIIIKGIGGFYYIEAADGIYECKARGVFRKSRIKPLAGDRVLISINDNAENTIEKIYERKNSLERPPVANVDKLFIVSSTCEPKPVLLLVDRLVALATVKNIEPIVVFTKNDLEDASEYIEIYRKAGIKAYSVSCVNYDGVELVKNELKGCISAFCGNLCSGSSGFTVWRFNCIRY
jgi:ribosome biogenesis GTPase